MQYLYNIGCPKHSLEICGFTTHIEVFSIQYESFLDQRDEDTDIPQLKNYKGAAHYLKFLNDFRWTLDDVAASCGAPLSYLLCKKIDPGLFEPFKKGHPWSVSSASVQAMMSKQMKHDNPHFSSDNAKLWQYLYLGVKGTSVKQQVDTVLTNGVKDGHQAIINGSTKTCDVADVSSSVLLKPIFYVAFLLTISKTQGLP